MHILFIGGSNTRMSRGYVTAIMSEAPSGAGFDNISVGISGCLMGIEQLHRYEGHIKPDVVFIEYSINDVSILAKNAALFWRKSYEGLVRQLAIRYPGVPLIALHFASRIPVHAPMAKEILAFMEALAARYGQFSVIDVAAELERKIISDERYSDDMHYSNTTFATISELAWRSMDASQSGCRLEEDLPSPLTEGAFQNVRLISAENMTGGCEEQFANSLMQFPMRILKAGDVIEMDAPGEVASISFVSSSHSGVLELQDLHGCHFIPTLHREVTGGKSLLMNSPAVWHDWSKPISSSQRIELRCRSGRLEPYREFWSMIEPSSQDVAVQIRSVLIVTP